MIKVHFIDTEKREHIGTYDMPHLPTHNEYVSFDDADARSEFGGFRVERIVLMAHKPEAICRVRRFARAAATK